MKNSLSQVESSILHKEASVSTNDAASCAEISSSHKSALWTELWPKSSPKPGFAPFSRRNAAMSWDPESAIILSKQWSQASWWMSQKEHLLNPSPCLTHMSARARLNPPQMVQKRRLLPSRSARCRAVCPAGPAKSRLQPASTSACASCSSRNFTARVNGVWWQPSESRVLQLIPFCKTVIAFVTQVQKKKKKPRDSNACCRCFALLFKSCLSWRGSIEKSAKLFC